MQSDELAIRQLVATWMAATEAGDVNTVLSLMADDVVFLLPGDAVMRKVDFVKLADVQSAPAAPKINGAGEIKEIKIVGEWAFMWSRLTMTATAADGAASIRAGHTLSILKKENGKWLLARDANLLMPVPTPDARCAQ